MASDSGNQGSSGQVETIGPQDSAFDDLRNAIKGIEVPKIPEIDHTALRKGEPAAPKSGDALDRIMAESAVKGSGGIKVEPIVYTPTVLPEHETVRIVPQEDKPYMGLSSDTTPQDFANAGGVATLIFDQNDQSGALSYATATVGRDGDNLVFTIDSVTGDESNLVDMMRLRGDYNADMDVVGQAVNFSMKMGDLSENKYENAMRVHNLVLLAGSPEDPGVAAKMQQVQPAPDGGGSGGGPKNDVAETALKAGAFGPR